MDFFIFLWFFCSQLVCLRLRWAMNKIVRSECTHCVRHISYGSVASAISYPMQRRTGWALILHAKTGTADWPNRSSWKIVGCESICNNPIRHGVWNGLVAALIGAKINGSGATMEIWWRTNRSAKWIPGNF